MMQQRPAVRFLLVGDGDRLSWAKARLRDAGLAERAIIPGILEGTAAADAYAAMDVFAFASLSDTQGLVLAEAMSAGLPIVALDAPGARDCVGSDAGLLLPASSGKQSFAEACMALLDDSARRRAWSVNARAVALRFSREHCLQTLTAAYDEMIERHQAGYPSPAFQRASAMVPLQQSV